MASAGKSVDINDLTVAQACFCTVTGCSCKWPECWGLGTDGVCLCIKSNIVCCKLMDERSNEDGKMCLCTEGGLFLVTPTTCCSQQEQCCCLDTRCALPCTEQVPMIFTCLPCCTLYPKVACCAKVKDLKMVVAVEGAVEGGEKKKEKDLSDVPVGKVRVWQACCCGICGLMCKYPECLGGKAEGTCCCLQGENSCCKLIQEQNDDKICCICCDGGQYIVMPSTCVQSTNTCFCLDMRCAFPCTDKVPCICTLLPGCVIGASKSMKLACCPLVEDLYPNMKEAPAQVVM